MTLAADARAPGAGPTWLAAPPGRCPSSGWRCSSASRASTCTGSTTRATSGSSSRPRSSASCSPTSRTSRAGRQRDARLVLISLAFLASAGFLGLHALATPGVLLPGPNTGFVIATPVGLFIASVFAACSVTGPRRPAGDGRRSASRTASCSRSCSVADGRLGRLSRSAGLPPLDGAAAAGEAVGPLTVLAVDQRSALYAFAAIADARALPAARRRRAPRDRRRARAARPRRWSPSSLSRNWRLSWWEWHVLMLARVRRDRRSARGASTAGADR